MANSSMRYNIDYSELRMDCEGEIAKKKKKKKAWKIQMPVKGLGVDYSSEISNNNCSPQQHTKWKTTSSYWN